MIYTVPWHPDVKGEMPAGVIEMLQQIEQRINMSVREPVELGFFARCIMNDTGLSRHAAITMIGLAIALGMVNVATTTELA